MFQKKKDFNSQINNERLHGSGHLPCKPGDQIQLYSKKGTYTVHSVSVETFTVTCERWRRTLTEQYWNEEHLWSDFKKTVK